MDQLRQTILQAIGALDPTNKRSDQRLVIFDIDDTLIRSSDDKPIPSVILLYNYAKFLDYRLVIITNRIGDEQVMIDTETQLRNAGITGYERVYFRSPNNSNNPWKFKNRARMKERERGYTIAMSVGDQDWDILGDEVEIAVKIT